MPETIGSRVRRIELLRPVHEVPRLFCFPYAGGNAAIFREWKQLLKDVAEVHPVQLPGRGKRIAEPAFRSSTDLVQHLVPEILPLLDRPFAFFGHSMGALIAFEVARLLEQRYSRVAGHVFLSAKSPVHLPRQSRLTYDLPDTEFLAELKSLKGTPDELLNDPEAMALLAPMVRADFQLVQTYQYVDRGPLQAPFTVLGGVSDSEIRYETLKRWQELTVKPCTISMLPGGHFFLDCCRSQVISVVATVLYSLKRKPTAVS